MKEFLAGWIVFQLIVIGLVGGIMVAEVDNKTFDCINKPASTIELAVIGMILPLTAFTDSSFVDRYCSAH